jgi:hypothetical protein
MKPAAERGGPVRPSQRLSTSMVKSTAIRVGIGEILG